MPGLDRRPEAAAVPVCHNQRTMMEEKVYRQIVDQVFHQIDAAFESADPDAAECTVSQGTLTILYQGKLRFILSPQTPVRQIWAAFKDQAWHFDRDPQTGRWLDDRGRGIELFGLVESTTREAAGEVVSIGA
jgi:CyaY protein